MKNIQNFIETLEKELELPIITKYDDYDVHIYAKLKKFNIHLITVRKLRSNWQLISCCNNVINNIYEDAK